MKTYAHMSLQYEERKQALSEIGGPFADGVAWIEGDLIPIKQARIPIIDQGFLHSDLTYDVPAVWDGRFFRLDDHIERLFESCKKVRLESPMDQATMRTTLVDMIARSGIKDAYVEMIVTRGFRFVRDASDEPHVANLYMLAVPYSWAMPLEFHPHGSTAVVTRTVRRVPPGAIDPTVKNLQWGDLIRGLQEARDRGSIYPLLPDGDGNLTEGAGYNVFVIRNGALRTPRRGVLEGITRRTILEIAAEKGLRADVTEVAIEELYRADEIFLCTTAGGVMPITELDGDPVGDGQVGPITGEIWDAYWQAHYDPKYSFQIPYA